MAVLDGHGTAAALVQFRDKLKAIESAPYDELITIRSLPVKREMKT